MPKKEGWKSENTESEKHSLREEKTEIRKKQRGRSIDLKAEEIGSEGGNVDLKLLP